MPWAQSMQHEKNAFPFTQLTQGIHREMNAEEIPAPGKHWQGTGFAKHRYRLTREVTTPVQGIFKTLETGKWLAVTLPG